MGSEMEDSELAKSAPLGGPNVAPYAILRLEIGKLRNINIRTSASFSFVER